MCSKLTQILSCGTEGAPTLEICLLPVSVAVFSGISLLHHPLDSLVVVWRLVPIQECLKTEHKDIYLIIVLKLTPWSHLHVKASPSRKSHIRTIFTKLSGMWPYLVVVTGFTRFWSMELACGTHTFKQISKTSNVFTQGSPVHHRRLQIKRPRLHHQHEAKTQPAHPSIKETSTQTVILLQSGRGVGPRPTH